MPLYFGDKEVSDLNLGSGQVTEVYLGSDLVWSSAPPVEAVEVIGYLFSEDTLPTFDVTGLDFRKGDIFYYISTQSSGSAYAVKRPEGFEVRSPLLSTTNPVELQPQASLFSKVADGTETTITATDTTLNQSVVLLVVRGYDDSFAFIARGTNDPAPANNRDGATSILVCAGRSATSTSVTPPAGYATLYDFRETDGVGSHHAMIKEGVAAGEDPGVVTDWDDASWGTIFTLTLHPEPYPAPSLMEATYLSSPNTVTRNAVLYNAPMAGDLLVAIHNGLIVGINDFPEGFTTIAYDSAGDYLISYKVVGIGEDNSVITFGESSNPCITLMNFRHAALGAYAGLDDSADPPAIVNDAGSTVLAARTVKEGEDGWTPPAGYTTLSAVKSGAGQHVAMLKNAGADENPGPFTDYVLTKNQAAHTLGIEKDAASKALERFSNLTAQEKAALTDFVNGLVLDGVWGNVYDVWTWAFTNETDATIGMKVHDAGFYTKFGTATHVPGKGYDFAAGGHLKMATNWSDMDASINGGMVYATDESQYGPYNPAANVDFFGVRDVGAGEAAYLRVRNVDNNHDYNALWDHTDPTIRPLITGPLFGDVVGLVAPVSTQITVMGIGGVTETESRTSGPRTAYPMIVNGRNTDTTPQNAQALRQSIFVMLKNATEPDMQAIRTRTNTFLEALTPKQLFIPEVAST